jgi:hypothetical protein
MSDISQENSPQQVDLDLEDYLTGLDDKGPPDPPKSISRITQFDGIELKAIEGGVGRPVPPERTVVLASVNDKPDGGADAPSLTAVARAPALLIGGRDERMAPRGPTSRPIWRATTAFATPSTPSATSGTSSIRTAVVARSA